MKTSELINTEIDILEDELAQHIEKIVNDKIARAKARWIAEVKTVRIIFVIQEQKK